MNVIVRKNYPVEKLPADLREGLPVDARVTVEIRETPRAAPRRISELVGKGPNVHGDEQDVLDWIRAGRGDD
jgi:hypothetical protein